MNIKKYQDYFHDGIIFILKQYDDKIEIWMESCEILPEWIQIDFPLSKRNAIGGKLILTNVKKIVVNDQCVKEIKQIYDDAGILEFDIHEGFVNLLVEWTNYPPKDRISEFEHIVIYANQIDWENIPNLLDSLDL